MLIFLLSFSTLHATITISGFSGIQTDHGVLLEWQTTTEENTGQFLIQRSVDCVNWETISAVEAAGFSTEKQFYSFEDTHLTSSEYFYYRLEVESIDVHMSFYSDIIPVSIEQEAVMTEEVPAMYVDLSGKTFSTLEEAPSGIYIIVAGEERKKIYYSKN